jgi:hypothetical protein
MRYSTRSKTGSTFRGIDYLGLVLPGNDVKPFNCALASFQYA